MNDDDEAKFQIKESRKEIIIRKLKNSIFQTYYRLIPSALTSNLFYSLLITLEFFQMTGLTLFDIRSKDEISEIKLETHKFHSLYYPIKLFKISCILFKEHSFLFSLILLYGSFIFLILHIVIYIYYYFNIIEIRNQITIYIYIFFKLMFYFDLFICSFLTIPLYTTYFSFYQCNSNKSEMLNFSNINCHDWFHYFNIVISTINSFLLTIIGLLSAYFLNENHLIPKVPWNNSFSLIYCIIFIEKILLSLCYIIKFKYSFSIKSILISVLMIIHTLIRLKKHFFRVKIIGFIKSCYEFSILFYSLLGIINHFYNSLNFKLSSFFLEIFTGICFGIMLLFVVDKLNQKTLFINSKMSLTENLCAAQLLYLLQLAKEGAQESIKKSIFLPILQQHRIKCFDMTCRCNSYFKFIKENFNDILEDSSYKEIKFALKRKLSIRRGEALRRNTMKKFSINNKQKVNYDWDIPQKSEDDLVYLLDFKTEDEKINKTILIYEIIRIIGENMLKTFPNCQRIRLYFSYLMVFYLGNKYRALYELMKIPKQSQGIKIQYEIFLCKKEIENQMQQELKNPLYEKYYVDSSQAISMESILDFNKLTNKMFDLVNSTSKLLIKFWQEILGFDSDLNDSESENNFSPLEQETKTNKKNKRAVYKYAVMISNGFRKMNKIYYKLRKIDSFKSKTVFQLYFEFLEKVIFNGEQSREIKQFINLNKFFQKDLKSENEFLIFHKDKINMDDVGSCVISADLMSLGKILNCNLQFGNIFKYEKDDLRMESINKLIPSYIADFHNDFILKYLQKSKSHIIGKNKLLFGLRSDGLTIPIIIFVKSVPNLEKSIRFIGLVKKLSKKHVLWKPPLNLYEESKNHDNLTLSMSNSKIVSFILTTTSGQVYGITKNALKLFGIPLNILLPPSNDNQIKMNLSINNNNNNDNKDKIQRENEILEITHIFKDLNFNNYSQLASLKSEVGIEVTIETACLKNYFHDFKESLETSHSNLLKCLNNFDPNLSFAKHQVRLSVIEFKFNDGLNGSYLFKIILLRNNDAFKNIIKRNYLQGKNEIFHNLILGSLKKNEKQHLKNGKNINSDKNSLIHVSSFKKSENEEEKNNEIEKKNSQKSFKRLTIPKQINYFFLIFFFSLFFLFLVALFEFLCSQWYSKAIFNYTEMFNLSNFRNLHIIQIIIYVESLLFLDNNIFSEDDFNRTQIILKLNFEINETLELLNLLHSYIDTIDNDINNMFNLKTIKSYDLKKNITFEISTNILSNLINQILVSINTLLENNNKISLTQSKSIFFSYDKNCIIDSKNKDIFYIMYNYCYSVRNLLDESISIMIHRYSNLNYFENSFRKYIVFIPYVIILLTIILDILVLKKLADYKISILKIFYLVNKKYGELIIHRCQIFVEYTKNFTKYTKMNIYKVFKNLSNKNENKEENESVTSNRLESNVEDDTKSLNSKNMLLKSINRLKTNTDENKDLLPKNELKNKEKQEKEDKIKNEKEEKIMKEKLKKELSDSKKNANRKMLIVLIGIIILLLFHLIYFSIVIILNSKFDNQIKNSIEIIYNLSNRGWMFFNFLFFYRQMIISNNDEQVLSNYNNITNLKNEIFTPKDLFYLYMTYTYSIETNIVLLTNKFNNGYRNKILDKTIEIENLLNSDKYCDTLKQFDKEYYENFLYDCNNFYIIYNGLKDNIHIIAGYIQANIPDYKNKNVDDIIKIIQLNSTFINYAELYISQGIIYEMIELEKGLEKFVDEYKNNITIRLTIIVSIIVIEFIFYILIWKYLKRSLSKDKEILNIIPNEAIIYSQKLKNAINNLNNFK